MIGHYELAHDEAYYWLFSKKLDWGFFDHPPGVALLIKLFSFGQAHEFFVRLGFLVAQCACVMLIWTKTQEKITALLLFFASPLASFSSLFALPDTALLLMTVIYLLALKEYFEDDSIKNCLLLALSISLLFYAKYHGVVIVGLTLLSQLNLFKRKSFYLVLGVSLLIFLPHLIWQWNHDFSTLRYHFLERPRSEFGFKRGLEFLLLQIVLSGLLVGPLVWITVFKAKVHNKWERSLKWISIGSVIFFYLSTFSKKVEANWTVFLIPSLIFLVADDEVWKKKKVKTLLIISFLICFGARFLLVLKPQDYLPKRLSEFHGWRDFSQKLKAGPCENRRVLANTYQLASKLSFYLKENVSALNYHSRKNQFDYWADDYPTENVCFLSDKKEFSEQSILAPDGKLLFVTTNFSYHELKEKKR